MRNLSSLKIGTYGMARSGQAVANWCLSHHLPVVTWDDKEQNGPYPWVNPKNWSVDLVVPSPGIPWATHPFLSQMPLISDSGLYLKFYTPTHLSVISGTNGKSTTTALLGHILKTQYDPQSSTGGNIGVSLFDVHPSSPHTPLIWELSSYQLELTPPFSSFVSLLTNITPDHLARHGTMQTYASIKERILTATHSFLCIDTPWCQTLALRNPHVETLSLKGKTATYTVKEGTLKKGTTPLLSLSDLPTLQGLHNQENAALAALGASCYGLSWKDIRHGLETFPGLEHRQERVGVKGSVTFINDSKATNVESVSHALSTYPRIYWLLGGRAKEDDILDLAPYFPNVIRAYTFGEAGPKFQTALQNKVSCALFSSMEEALLCAAEEAGRDPLPSIVLLSPAATSWDAFLDFAHRGDVFRQMVLSLGAAPLHA